MTKFRWHTLDKRKRDPGWADARPEPSAKTIEPRSPFRSRKKGTTRLAVGGSGSAASSLKKLKRQGKKKKSGTGKGTGRTGATTPFDYYSLGAVSDLKKRMSVMKARKKAAKVKAQKGTATRKLARPPEKRATRKPVGPKPKSAAPAPKGFPAVTTLGASVAKITSDSVTIAWARHADVVRWKVTCRDESGQVLRKSGLHKDVQSVMLGGLEEASGQLLLRVRGHNSLGQLVCEGVLSGVSLKRR